jgi:hypothetical protein
MSAPEPSLNSGQPGGSRFEWKLFLLLLLTVIVVFHPVLKGELLDWDDDINISRNPHLKGLNWAQVKWAFTDTTYMWRYQPLGWITWLVIYEAFGLEPFFYHLTVLLFHAANAGLVFLLLRRLLLLTTRTAAPAPGALLICAAIASAVWAVHPMRVETTAWAVEMVYVQALFFFLMSLLAYLKAFGVEGVPRRARYYWLAVASFAASLFSFPLALGGLVVFCILDVIPLRRLNMDPHTWWRVPIRGVWLEKIPFLIVTLAATGANLYVRAHNTGTWAKPVSLEEFGLVPRVMQAFFIWAYYVWRPWLPVNLTPASAQLIDFRPLEWPFVMSAIGVVGLTAGLFFLRRRWPSAHAIWMCYLALLVPVLGLTEHPHFPADRYSLVVSIGWSVLAAGWFWKLWPSVRRRRLALTVAGVMIALLGVMSYRQTFIWRTNGSLFNHIIARLGDDPHRTGIYFLLGNTYLRQGENTKAVEAYRRAIEISPKLAQGHNLLGDALAASGELNGAIVSYREALRLDPGLVAVLNDLGVACARQGQLDLAVEQFAEVLHRDPQNLSAIRNMIQALTLQGKTNEASAYVDRADSLQDR